MQFLKKLAYNKCVLTRVKKCDKINTERREAVVVKKSDKGTRERWLGSCKSKRFTHEV